MKSKKKILIIGKKPPPIGGVTIHVSRLLLKLSSQSDINYHGIEISKKELLKLIFYINKYDKLHLHTSSPILRFIIACICKISLCKSIVTFHGDINRYKSKWLNLLDIITIKLADYPIVLNDKSFQIALNHNINTKKITSFISPILENETISLDIQKNIEKLKSKTSLLFCINAYNLTFDKNNVEIYGIYEVLDFFKEHQNLGLVFSDPSGVYTQKLKNENVDLPPNIYVISENHSFYKIISFSDISIRNTSTDGDSLSVKESLFLNKKTLCTDVVSRPEGVILYQRNSLKSAILKTLDTMKVSHEINIDEATNSLFKIYTQ